MQKGIEYFVELTFFYGMLMAFAAYELRKSMQNGRESLKVLDELEQKHARLDIVLNQLKEQEQTFLEPSEQNKVYIEKLKLKVHDLEDNI